MKTEKNILKICVGFTFLGSSSSVDILRLAKSLGLNNVSLKDFHSPYYGPGDSIG